MKNKNKKGLSIIIVGCGKVGATLVEVLVKEGHNITLIDTNSARVAEVAGMHDVMGVVGNGASFSVLKEAGIEDTDLVIAVTESDELNLSCCMMAKQETGCAAIARVINPDYSRENEYLRQKLDLAMVINPQYEFALEASRILYMPSALEVHPFAHGLAEMIKFKIPKDSVLCDKRVKELSGVNIRGILICAVERNQNVYIPSGEFILREGDVISFLAPRKNVRVFLDTIGVGSQRVKNTMIVGGGLASEYLAKILISMGVSVKIIESSRNRCEELSVALPEAVIINGDGSNQDLLKEEGIEYTESFVPLTGLDEENILLSLYARKVSGAKPITKIDHVNFRNVITDLELGSVIYPRYLTTEAIIAYVRGRNNSTNNNIETMYHMFDNRIEAIEFRIQEKSEVTGIPLKDLHLKKDLLVSFISRKGKIIIPSGLDTLEPKDTVMIVTSQPGLSSINDILER